MRAILFVILLTAYCCQLHSQQPEDLSKKYISETKFPFVLVDSLVTSMHAMIIDPNNIESIKVLKGTTATDLYGDKAFDGAIIISTKKGVRLSRIEALYEKYNYPDSARSYRVSIDQQPVVNKKLIVVDESYVKEVNVHHRSGETGLPGNTQEGYLNIITRKPK